MIRAYLLIITPIGYLIYLNLINSIFIPFKLYLLLRFGEQNIVEIALWLHKRDHIIWLHKYQLYKTIQKKNIRNLAGT